MATAYYANYRNGHQGAIDRIGGLPSHLPESIPHCECTEPMAFICQIYFEGKDLSFVPVDLMGIQFYSCFQCLIGDDQIVKITKNAEPNHEGAGREWSERSLWRDITWTVKEDPEPTCDVEQFLDDKGNFLPSTEPLLENKMGGCFPVVDDGGTSAFELGIVAELSFDHTIYLTVNDDEWKFFRY